MTVLQLDQMGVEPKIGGKTLQIIHFNRVFHYFHHPFWGFSPYFWFNTQMTFWKFPACFGDASTFETVSDISSEINV